MPYGRACKLALACFLLVAAPYCAPISEIKKPVFQPDYHIVKKGETLNSIARKYGVALSDVLEANKISSPDRIKTGQRIKIPDKRSFQVAEKKPDKTKKRPKTRRRIKEKSGKVKINNGYFMTPVKGALTSKFGIRKSGKHDGIDIAAKRGTPIYAAASGRVIFSGWGPTGYGRVVIIKHSANVVTVYAHNSKNLVKANQRVKKGEKIALVGRSGRATGHHLHFEIRINRKPVDPLKHVSG